MALSDTESIVQILEDTTTHARVLLMHHANTAAQETDALKVNVALLRGRMVTLTTSNVDMGLDYFEPGENIAVDGGATGTVLSWTPSNTTSNGTLTAVVNSGVFANNDVVVGDRRAAEATVVNVTVPEYTMNITEAWWSIPGSAKVELEWKGNSVFTTAVVLSGSGEFGKNSVQSAIPNRAVSPRDGNLYVSTFGLAANGGYTIVVTLRKGAGFASAPIY